jgi:hypothetical protein
MNITDQDQNDMADFDWEYSLGDLTQTHLETIPSQTVVLAHK